MRYLHFLAVAAFGLALASCAAPKDTLYFQNIDQTELVRQTTAYEAVIKKDDRLTIVVTGPDKVVTSPYNLTLSENANGIGGNLTDPERSTLGYLVDPEGNIDFPILGKIHVEGMTRNQLVEYLTERISQDVKNPIVYVSFRNYKISILGEVKAPGTYTMTSEKVNILQALSMAGDLNLTAKRDGVLLLREEDGKIKYHRIDLRDSELLNSPYFFLQQNDIIYVEPRTGRVASATNSVGVWSSFVASLASVLAIITTVVTLTR